MDRKKLQIKAFAKINLTLDILDKLPNGYHQIRSVFQAVNLYDIISITRIANSGQTRNNAEQTQIGAKENLILSPAKRDEESRESFYLTGSVVCPLKDNLITKAKEALENFTGKSLPCKIHLIKNIPISAGLGGGSSDTAATLIGLNKLFSLNLGLKQLAKIGLVIGSDVPFFLYGKGAALVEGIGDKIKPIRRDSGEYINFPRKSAFRRHKSAIYTSKADVYILARPHKRISTAEIYSLFDKRGKTFFELAKEICPDVGKLYDYFAPFSKACRMSGTGPTIFAGFDSYGKAVKSIENFGVEKFNGDFFVCEPSDKTFEIV